MYDIEFYLEISVVEAKEVDFQIPFYHKKWQYRK